MFQVNTLCVQGWFAHDSGGCKMGRVGLEVVQGGFGVPLELDRIQMCIREI